MQIGACSKSVRCDPLPARKPGSQVSTGLHLSLKVERFVQLEKVYPGIWPA